MSAFGEVYVVTSGEYSDYSIEALFSTKEAAEEYVKVVNATRSYNVADIEVYPLNETVKQARGPFVSFSSVIRLSDAVILNSSETVVFGPLDHHEFPQNVYKNMWMSTPELHISTKYPVEERALAEKSHHDKVAQIRQEIIEGTYEYTYKTIYLANWNYGYDWNVTAVLQRSDGAFAVVEDGGCSCTWWEETDHFNEQTEWFHGVNTLYTKFDNAVANVSDYKATAADKAEAKSELRVVVANLT